MSSNALSKLAKPSASRRSSYTSLEPASCAIIKETAENAGSSRRCAGVAGYVIETRDTGPAQYFAIVSPDGERSRLDLPGIAANGSLGKLAEWRDEGGGEPRALIVRVGPPGKSAASTLVVARLGPAPCIVAVIPRGPRQNQNARDIADQKQLDCRTP